MAADITVDTEQSANTTVTYGLEASYTVVIPDSVVIETACKGQTSISATDVLMSLPAGSQNMSTSLNFDLLDEVLYSGEYSDNITFTVALNAHSEETPAPVNGFATFKDGVTLTWEELKDPANGDKYSYDAGAITDTEIYGLAFNLSATLTSINMPDGITTIGSYSFLEPRLTSVNLPDSITAIDEYAFSRCNSLTYITFRGTTAQWNAITFGVDLNLGVPATEVICSDGTVSLS